VTVTSHRVRMPPSLTVNTACHGVPRKRMPHCRQERRSCTCYLAVHEYSGCSAADSRPPRRRRSPQSCTQRLRSPGRLVLASQRFPRQTLRPNGTRNTFYSLSALSPLRTRRPLGTGSSSRTCNSLWTLRTGRTRGTGLACIITSGQKRGDTQQRGCGEPFRVNHGIWLFRWEEWGEAISSARCAVLTAQRLLRKRVCPQREPNRIIPSQKRLSACWRCSGSGETRVTTMFVFAIGCLATTERRPPVAAI
jgi:hypothetical protein